MSGWATGWVMKNVKGIPAARKLVLLVLADEANDDGCHCFPSVRRIADHADIGVGTARNHLNELEAAGLIVIDRPEKQGRGHFNRYGIVMDRTVEEVQADLDEERGRKPTPSRGEKGVRKGSERGR